MDPVPQSGTPSALRAVGVRVKIGGIRRRLDGRLDGRGEFHGVQVSPSKFREPLVSLDIISALLEASVALGKVSSEQLFDQAFCVPIKVTGKCKFAGEDHLINSHGIVVHKRRLAGEHLIHQDAKRPPVDALSVALIQKHLWRDVLGRAAQRISLEDYLLRKAKIRNFHKAVAVEKKIFGLQIAVDDIFFVQVLKDERYRGGVKLSRRVLKASSSAKVREKLAAVDVVKNHVQKSVVLKGA